MIIWTRFPWVYSKNGINVFVVGKTRNYLTTNAYSSSGSVDEGGGSCYCGDKGLKLLPHVPVLAHRVNDFIQPEKCELVIDMTFGSGGHTRHFLQRSKRAKVLCLDRDPVAYEYALGLQDEYPGRVLPLLGKFSNLASFMKQHGYGPRCADAILFDLGPSSMQFDDARRGFALSKDGPLDMRMDGKRFVGEDDDYAAAITAADVLAYAHELDLQKIFKLYGDEPHAKKIARAVVETRLSYRPLTRTFQLRDLVASVVGERLRIDKLGRFAHPSTKVFQALRVFVNDELNQLEYGLRLAGEYLKLGGVLVVLSFHSFEDALVKRHITGKGGSDIVIDQLPLKFYNFKAASYDSDTLRDCHLTTGWKPLTKHVCLPTPYEMSINPRSRSAKLRACIKTA